MSRFNLFAIFVAIFVAIVAFFNSCQQQTPINNANLSTTNANTYAGPVESPSPPIEAREPDIYSATVTLTAQTAGSERVLGIPPLTFEVSRDGDYRRYAFRLPNGEQVIYLDRGDQRYLLLPDRRQYVELNRETIGFEVPRVMTPSEMVDELRRRGGYERVGEEEINGRTVIKYRYATTTRTDTQAGNVQAENFVYVDKETGLPLRSELFSEAEREVQGVKSVRIVAEMRDLRIAADPKLFEVPQGFARVSGEQVKQQIDALAALISATLQGIAQAAAQPSPTASPTGR
jgi:hypothetical protein